MKYKYIILLTMVLHSCGGDDPQTSTTEPTPPTTPESKSTFEYKTYKRITPMNGIENEYLSRHADVEKVSREIMNIYDSKN